MLELNKAKLTKDFINILATDTSFTFSKLGSGFGDIEDRNDMLKLLDSGKDIYLVRLEYYHGSILIHYIVEG